MSSPPPSRMAKESPDLQHNRKLRFGMADDQGEEFFPRLLLLSEAAEHGAGNRLRMLLLDPAHHHAQMPRLDDHSHSLGANLFHQGLRNLRRQPLLNLEAASKHV